MLVGGTKQFLSSDPSLQSSIPLHLELIREVHSKLSQGNPLAQAENKDSIFPAIKDSIICNSTSSYAITIIDLGKQAVCNGVHNEPRTGLYISYTSSTIPAASGHASLKLITVNSRITH